MNKDHMLSVDLSICNRCGLCRNDFPHDLWSTLNPIKIPLFHKHTFLIEVGNNVL